MSMGGMGFWATMNLIEIQKHVTICRVCYNLFNMVGEVSLVSTLANQKKRNQYQVLIPNNSSPGYAKLPPGNQALEPSFSCWRVDRTCFNIFTWGFNSSEIAVCTEALLRKTKNHSNNSETSGQKMWNNQHDRHKLAYFRHMPTWIDGHMHACMHMLAKAFMI